jgi:hypothetical protein
MSKRQTVIFCLLMVIAIAFLVFIAFGVMGWRPA